ncbi:MAG TPA: phospholipase [Planctomycetaceae bacterium]|nr:phospholipase [Planctomycetaceae bacterium]
MGTRREHLAHITTGLGLFIVWFSLANSSDAAEVPAPGKQVGQKFRSQKNPSHSCQYLIFLPRTYKASGRPSPLLLFLHGSGERGDDLELVKKHGPPKLVTKRPDFPFVTVSPQVRRGERFSAAALLELINHLQANYNVDRKRTSVTGLSMGGAGTWAVANAAPDRFAAIVPICGTAKIDSKKFLQLPTWATVGGKDRASLVEELQKTVAGLRDRGAPIRFTLYPQLGHNCWDATYGNPKLYEWILAQSTDKRPKQKK